MCMTKHPSRKVMNFRHSLGCGTIAGIDAASRFKVTRPLKTKQVKDVAEMIADIYKVGPLTYPSTFQCDNRSEFKGEVTKMLEKHEVKIQ